MGELGDNYIISVPTDITMFNNLTVGSGSTIYADQQVGGSWINLRGIVLGSFWLTCTTGGGDATVQIITSSGVVLDGSTLGDTLTAGTPLQLNIPETLLAIGDARLKFVASGATTGLNSYFYGIYGGFPSTTLGGGRHS